MSLVLRDGTTGLPRACDRVAGAQVHAERAQRHDVGNEHRDLGTRSLAAGRGASQVIDAAKMLAIESFSVASNSSSLCWTERPSVRAREKLAITPWLRARRVLASPRL